MTGLLLVFLLAPSAPALTAGEAPAPTRTEASPAKPASLKPGKKTRSRTLKEVISVAMEKGVEKTIPLDWAELLFGKSAELQAKRLRYKASTCPDKREHNLSVIISREDDNPPSPVGLYMSVLKGEERDGVRFVKGYDFRATLDGKLEKAYLSDGNSADLEPLEQDLSSKEVRDAFAAEIDFHLRLAPRLGLDFVK